MFDEPKVEEIHLNEKDSRRVAESLINPPPPNDALRKLMREPEMMPLDDLR